MAVSKFLAISRQWSGKRSYQLSLSVRDRTVDRLLTSRMHALARGTNQKEPQLAWSSKRSDSHLFQIHKHRTMHEIFRFAIAFAVRVTARIQIGGMLPPASNVLLLDLTQHLVPQFPAHRTQVEPRQLLGKVSFEVGQQLRVGLILHSEVVGSSQFVHFRQHVLNEVFLETNAFVFCQRIVEKQ